MNSMFDLACKYIMRAIVAGTNVMEPFSPALSRHGHYYGHCTVYNGFIKPALLSCYGHLTDIVRHDISCIYEIILGSFAQGVSDSYCKLLTQIKPAS